MISINLSDKSILKIKNADYRCIVSGNSKSEAINLLQINDLTEKNVTWKINIKNNFKAANLLKILI